MHVDTTSKPSSSTANADADNEAKIAEICERVATDMTTAGLECTPSDVRNANMLMQFAEQYVKVEPSVDNKNVRIIANPNNKHGMSAAIILARMARQLGDADETERTPLVAIAVVQALALLQPPKLSKTLGRKRA